MKIKTAISKVGEEDVIIRGERLATLVAELSFSDAIFLVLLGRRPDSVESRLFAGMLTAIIDHGTATTSAVATRWVASGGNALNAAVAGGVLALGDYHGGAIERSMRMLEELSGADEKAIDAYVAERLEKKKPLFGFGHKVYKSEDPRVRSLLGLCDELSYRSAYVDLARALEAALERAKGRKICLNVDGLFAALLLEMGFPPEAGKGLFIIGRTPGLVAHATEELLHERPVRRVPEEDVEYTGKANAS